jgi:hypothetical protein
VQRGLQKGEPPDGVVAAARKVNYSGPVRDGWGTVHRWKHQGAVGIVQREADVHHKRAPKVQQGLVLQELRAGEAQVGSSLVSLGSQRVAASLEGRDEALRPRDMLGGHVDLDGVLQQGVQLPA